MIKSVNYSNAVITGGIWKEKQKMVRSTSIHAIYDRFAETGRFDALRFDWKEGMPNKPHIFWDSDVAKWIESAAYLTALKKEPKLEKEIDRLVDLIEKNQCEDGYFNIYFTTIWCVSTCSHNRKYVFTFCLVKSTCTSEL